MALTRRLATIATALVVTVTLGAPGASADDTGGAGTSDLGGAVGHYPLVLEKTEDTPYLTPSGAPVRVPSVALQEAGEPVERAAGLAGAAAAGADTGCLPYSVHALVTFEDELARVVVQDYVRFRLLWCADGARDPGPGEGACTGYPWVPYRPGVARCWWSKGLWGGWAFSFRTGGTYHVRAGVDGVAPPPDPVTITLDHGAVWRGPGTEVEHDQRCWVPDGLPATWTVGMCKVYVTSDW